jgi:hypothetical protein
VSSQLQNPVPDTQTLAWAGLALPLPRDYRPARIEGNHEKGLILLADDHRPRLVLAWATVTRREFDPTEFCTQKLISLFDSTAGVGPSSVKRVSGNPSFTTMIYAHSREEEKIRAVGYCPATGRIIDSLYHVGTAREDMAFTEGLLRNITDQPIDKPYQWGVLGSSFTVPEGFRYLESTLNLGDQLTRFIAGKSEANGPVLVVRQVYPADLALSRQSLEEWLEDWATGRGASYAPKTHRQGVTFPVVKDPATLAGHVGFSIESHLRIPLKISRWWMPRHSRFYAVHHKGVDRLVFIQVAGPLEMLEPWAATVASSLSLTAE